MAHPDSIGAGIAQCDAFCESSSIEPLDAGLHRRFELQALRCPAAVAVVEGATRLSYRQVNEAANRLAHYLKDLGVQPEVMVGVYLGRSHELIVAILAVLKAGGAYVPLDPDYPAERLAFQVRDAALSVVITRETFPVTVSEGCRIVSLNVEHDAIGAHSAEDLTTEVDPESLLYLIYTSGSTGEPKGVMVTHRNVARLFDVLGPKLGFSAEDIWSFYHSPAFGYSAWEIWGPLTHGGRIVIVPSSTRMSPVELRELLRKEEVSVLSLTPSAFRQLMLHVAFESDAAVQHLRMIALSGEGVVRADLRRWFSIHRESHPEIIDTYAITETGGQVAWRRLGAADAATDESNLLGELLSDTRVHLLDRHLQPVEPGTDGELCVSGPGVARGYWNRRELTEEKFVQDPQDPARRLYRTGDRGRMRPDGRIALIGRGDDQIKMRGFRVELEEIETALRDHPRVKEAAVVLRENDGQSPRLAAYVVARRPEKAATPGAEQEAELWPSLGEYQIYDEVLYYLMTSETVRNAAYKEAINRHVKDKVVLDIGTGQHAILARFCVEAGAKRIYAIEVLDDAYEEAAKLVQESGLSDRIIVIHGDSTTVRLPELVDVCTEGIIGNIGSSDGIIPIMNDARRWFRPGAIAIPNRCVTYFAAVQLPDSLHENPCFGSLPRRYVETIFAQAGRRFDIRLCVRNFPASHVVSDSTTFEDLDFSGPIDPEEEGQAILTVTKDGRFDGFLLWTHVTTTEGVAIDYLQNQQAWLPVYFPLSDDGVKVQTGGTISVRWRRTLCENGLNPDYFVQATIMGSNGRRAELSYQTKHYESAYLQTAIHRRLFAHWEKPASDLSLDALRAYLERRLPDYMIPSAFVFLDELPRNANGKLDRKRLPAPGTHRPNLATPFVKPESPLQRKVAAIWGEVLKVDAVGLDDSFFDLGGHSLVAVQILARINVNLGLELPLSAIFEHPSVRKLSTEIDSTRPIRNASGSRQVLATGQHEQETREHVAKRGGGLGLPLSFAQARIWFLNQLAGSSLAYLVQDAHRLRGNLDLQALQAAVQALVTRHESLRTRFEEIDGEPCQIIETEVKVPIVIEDLSDLDERARDTAIAIIRQRDANEPFDLQRGPLLKVKLLKLGDHDHILTWICHHIVSDGWSLGVFNRDLAQLYAAFRNGTQNPLKPLPIQYADYAILQREMLQGEKLEKLLRYWSHQLAESQILDFPGDRPRPTRHTLAGAKASLVIPQTINNTLRDLSRLENVTVFMTLLAALKVLLFRYTGQEDISIGIPIANRGRADLQDLIGCFLNTLVLRTQLESGKSFRGLLRRVREVTLQAYAHQELPFEMLLEELKPERSLSRSPLFQVFVNFLNFEDEKLNLPDLNVEKFEYTETEAKFDLNFYLSDIEKHLRLDLIYNTDLFDSLTIQKMLERFEILLEAIVADPDQKIGALKLLTLDDRKTRTINDSRVQPANPYIQFPLSAIEQSIGSRFDEQAGKHSTRTAVKTQTHEWTYAELERRANRIAHEMLRLSPETGQRVALLLDHDAPMIAAILGSLKAGKTYVPLSPFHPRERIATIIADSESRLLFTDAANKKLARELAAGGLPLIEVEGLADDPGAVPHHRDVSPDGLAYLLYTSGSTGQPKGIAQSHRNVLHHIRNCTNSLHICPNDRMLLLASYGFDAAVMDIFGAVLNGATLLPFDIRKHEFISLSRWIAATQTTIYHSTPTVFRHFMRAIPERGALASVRVVLMGGEPVQAQDFDLFREGFSRTSLFVNGFGQTEYSFSLQYFADVETEIVGGAIPIGYPVDNTEIALLDGEGHPGQIFGEIAVHSPYLAPGYWGRLELTAAAFKEDHVQGNMKTYRTGDLGRLRVDGTIEFAGRKDFQVKIRGNRVELGEIETALQRHADIKSAVVVARHSPGSEDQLVAYAVLKDSRPISGDELREFLARSLPDYMVPSAFMTLDEMPLTPNGKINRDALPLPEREGSALQIIHPRTPFEKILADIWKELLQLDTIGVHDDFFEQGGHSLIATRLVSQIRKSFDVEIPIRAVFEKRTIEKLVFYIAELQAGEAAPDEIEKLLAELE
jgi:amino acid adenylation domain-containing protein